MLARESREAYRTRGYACNLNSASSALSDRLPRFFLYFGLYLEFFVSVEVQAPASVGICSIFRTYICTEVPQTGPVCVDYFLHR